jgi:hypothetical protein
MNKLKKMALMVVGQNLNTDELQGTLCCHCLQPAAPPLVLRRASGKHMLLQSCDSLVLAHAYMSHQ